MVGVGRHDDRFELAPEGYGAVVASLLDGYTAALFFRVECGNEALVANASLKEDMKSSGSGSEVDVEEAEVVARHDKRLEVELVELKEDCE